MVFLFFIVLSAASLHAMDNATQTTAKYKIILKKGEIELDESLIQLSSYLTLAVEKKENNIHDTKTIIDLSKDSLPSFVTCYNVKKLFESLALSEKKSEDPYFFKINTSRRIENERDFVRDQILLADFLGIDAHNETLQLYTNLFFDLSHGKIDEALENTNSFDYKKTSDNQKSVIIDADRGSFNVKGLVIDSTKAVDEKDSVITLWGIHNRINPQARNCVKNLYLKINETIARINLAYIASLFSNCNELTVKSFTKSEFLSAPAGIVGLHESMCWESLQKLHFDKITIPSFNIRTLLTVCPFLKRLEIIDGGLSEVINQGDSNWKNETLWEINLSQNCLKKIPYLATIKHLHKINVSYNNIKTVDLDNFRSECDLNLCGQEITSVAKPKYHDSKLYLERDQKIDVSAHLLLKSYFRSVDYV